MSHETRSPGEGTPQAGGLDREINLRVLAGFALALVAVIAISGLLMWGVASYLGARIAAEDPPAPVLPQASAPWELPGPRLQTHPERDLAALRAEEERLLTGYEWLDEQSGVARIPVGRAMELLAQGVEPRPRAAAAEGAEP